MSQRFICEICEHGANKKFNKEGCNVCTCQSKLHNQHFGSNEKKSDAKKIRRLYIDGNC